MMILLLIMSNYIKKTVHGTALIFLFSLVAAICGYVVRVILAKNLSLTDFGFFYALVSLGAVLMVFRDFGLGQASLFFVPRLIAKKKKGELKDFISKIVKVELISSFFIAFCLVLLSGFLVKHYFHYGSFFVVIFFAIGFFLNSLELTFQTFFQAFQNQFLFSFHNFSRSFLALIFILIIAVFTSSIYLPILAYGITYAVILVVFVYVFFKKTYLGFFSTVSKVGVSFKNMFLFGFSAALFNLSFILITSTDVLLLTYFRTLEEVGLYNAVLPIISLMLYFPFAVSAVVTPYSSELWEHKKKEVLKKSVELVTKFSFIILIVLGGILCIYPDIALRILFGEAFVAGRLALVFLAGGAIFYGIAYLNMSFLMGVSGPKNNLFMNIAAAVLNVILNFILVQKYGIYGAALSTAVSYLFLFILSTVILYKKIDLHVHIKWFVGIILSGVFFFASVHFLKLYLQLSVYFELFVTLFISGTLYLLLLFLLRIVSVKEIKFIVSQLKK